MLQLQLLQNQKKRDNLGFDTRKMKMEIKIFTISLLDKCAL